MNIDPNYDENQIHILVPYRKKDCWGYSDLWGKIVIAPNYKKAEFFRLSKILPSRDYRAIVEKNNSYFLIDKFENIRSKNYAKIEYQSAEEIALGVFIVTGQNNKKGALIEDKEILQTKFDRIQFNQGFFEVLLNQKYGLYDIRGEQILDHKYSSIEKLQNDWNILHEYKLRSEDGDEEMIIYNEDVLVKRDFEALLDSIVIHTEREDSLFFRFDYKNKQGLVILSNEKTIPPLYDSIEVPLNHTISGKKEVENYHVKNDPFLFVVELKGKVGLIDEDHNTLLPIEYDSITHRGYGNLNLSKNNLKGIYRIPSKNFFLVKCSEIRTAETLYIQDNVSFSIFKLIRKDLSYDYISENGIEYFEN